MKKSKILQAVVSASLILSSFSTTFTAEAKKCDRLTLMTYASVYSEYGLRNKNYINLSSNCTNFVSQCLGPYGGNLKQTDYNGLIHFGNAVNSTKYWFYKKENCYSSSWTSATDFGKYWCNSGRCKYYVYDNSCASYKKIFGMLNAGDVIQFGDDNGNYYHSVICITPYFNYNTGCGTVKFAQNSDDKTYTFTKQKITVNGKTDYMYSYPQGWCNSIGSSWTKLRLIKTSEADD